MSYDALFEARLTLENEGKFYSEYHETAPDAFVRRDTIRKWARLTRVPALTTENIEQLRRYFDDRYCETLRPLVPAVACSAWGAWEHRNLPDPWSNAKPATPTPTPVKSDNSTIEKESIMTTTAPIEITTKTLANGVDIASMADASIYALISAEEARIKELQAIESKPKMLEAEIAKRKAGVAALVAHLDSKFKG